MMNQPDKLFRDKLHDHQKPARAEAWERIEQNLDVNKKSWKWWHLAAAMILFAISGALLWTLRETPRAEYSNQVPQADEKNNVTPLQAPENFQANAEEKELKEIPAQHHPPTAAIASATKRPQRNVRVEVKEENIIDKEKNVVEELLDVNQSSSLPDIAQTVIEPVMKPERTHTTIVLKAEEVNQKYLIQNSVADATSDEKKSSTFRKLLDKASDLKYQEDPLSEIRQKKSEILALNFKNEKRGQNK